MVGTTVRTAIIETPSDESDTKNPQGMKYKEN